MTFTFLLGHELNQKLYVAVNIFSVVLCVLFDMKT